MTTLAVPFFWTTPTSFQDIAILSSLGIFGGLGHYCVARAMTYGPANVLSPFQYFQLIGSVIVGFLMFSEVPDVFTWLGAAVIIASGLFIGWLESRRRPAAASA
jgi:drug/metabolite transporter (DMT)-like permease